MTEQQDRERSGGASTDTARYNAPGASQSRAEDALAIYRAEIEEAEREEQEEKRKARQKPEPSKSLVAPMKPGKASPVKPGGRGSPTSATRPPTSEKPTENRVPKNVPTTLEGALQFEGEGKGIHETLGVLVKAHSNEAKAILGRTNLVSHEDVIAVADIFHLAKHGIGGKYDEPQPFLSEWALDILEGLPSIEGKSRSEFVEAWSSAEKERARAQAEADRNAKRIGS